MDVRDNDDAEGFERMEPHFLRWGDYGSGRYGEDELYVSISR